MIDRITVSGTIDDVGQRMAEFVDAGARHLIVCPIHGDVPDVAGRLLADVLPRLPTRARDDGAPKRGDGSR